MARAGQVSPANLPAYYPLQTAFHEAFRNELYRIIDKIPLPPTARVLDVPCGDGFYSLRLASRLGKGGQLTLADASPAYLALAKNTVAPLADRTTIQTSEMDIYNMPFPDGHFDLLWCAQSLISLEDPAAAMAEMARVIRPNGTLAVLESDEFHHLLLTWPVDLELAVEAALRDASRARYGDGGHLAPARRIRRLMQETGLRSLRKLTFAGDREAPFPPSVRHLLELHLEHISGLVQPYLQPAHREAFTRFITPGQRGNVFERQDAELTCLNVLHLARKPAFTRPARKGRDWEG